MNVAATVTSLAPTSGQLRGNVHILPVRVYYEDTDAGAIVYYANYLKFAERGRTEFLRALGIEQQRLRSEAGLQFVMHEAEVKYKKPAYLDDILLVETGVHELKAASLVMHQLIKRGGEELVNLVAHVACTAADGKPMRLPAQLRSLFESHVQE